MGGQMQSTRIKVKIGDHEFEAEGPTDTVKEQFEAFKQMISIDRGISSRGSEQKVSQGDMQQRDTDASLYTELPKIMEMSGRVISLTALPTSTGDAALLILLGQKELRENIASTAQEVGDGLAQSGRPVPRVDRVMDSAIQQALVLKTGVKRSTRYRLTNQGVVRARELARELVTSVS
jgi:hypothetical protein